MIDAVVLSRATGKPVKVVWSREDDVRHDKMRPLTAQFLQAGADAAGALVARGGGGWLPPACWLAST